MWDIVRVLPQKHRSVCGVSVAISFCRYRSVPVPSVANFWQYLSSTGDNTALSLCTYSGSQYWCLLFVTWHKVVCRRQQQQRVTCSVGHCKRYRATRSHRATGPDSMWTLTPHTGPCGTYALNPVALCDTQRAVNKIVKRPSEQFSKRPWSNTWVCPTGPPSTGPSSIDSGPVALYLLQWPCSVTGTWKPSHIPSTACADSHQRLIKEALVNYRCLRSIHLLSRPYTAPVHWQRFIISWLLWYKCLLFLKKICFRSTPNPCAIFLIHCSRSVKMSTEKFQLRIVAKINISSKFQNGNKWK